MTDNFEEFVNRFIDPKTGFIGQQTAFLDYLDAQFKQIDSQYPVRAEDAQASSLSNNYFVKNVVLTKIKSIIVDRFASYQKHEEEIVSNQAYQSFIEILQEIEEKQAEFTTLLNSEKSTRYFLGISIPKHTIWEELFIHFCSLPATSLPTQKWLNITQGLLNGIGKADYLPLAIRWMEKALEKSLKYKERWQYFDRESQTKELKLDPYQPEPWMAQVYTFEREMHAKGSKRWEWQEPTNGQFYFYYTFGGRFLRGIILSAAFLDNEQLFEAIEKFAIANPSESSDAIAIFSGLPPQEAITRLSRLQHQMNNQKVRQKIEKVIQSLNQV